MFNTKLKYESYEVVPHGDSGDEMDGMKRELLLTAHRRIINIEDGSDESDDSEHTQLIKKATDNESGSDSDITDILYDDFVFLLFLNGNKRRVGIMKNWKISEFKNEHFANQLKDGQNVRLIYRGKLLEDAVFICVYGIQSNGFIHVSIAKSIHCNDTNYDNFDDGINDEALARRLQQRELMFDDDDTHTAIDRDQNENSENSENNENSQNRARREFLCGVFLGSVAGIWILVFLILSQTQRGYSRRFRLGVALGVIINLMIQLSYDQTVDTPDANDAATDDATTEDATTEDATTTN